LAASSVLQWRTRLPRCSQVSWNGALGVLPGLVSHVGPVTCATSKAARVSENVRVGICCYAVDTRWLFCVSGAVVYGWLTVLARITLWNQLVHSGEKQNPFNPG